MASKKKHGRRPSIPIPEEIAERAKEIREENIRNKKCSKRDKHSENFESVYVPKVHKTPNGSS